MNIEVVVNIIENQLHQLIDFAEIIIGQTNE